MLNKDSTRSHCMMTLHLAALTPSGEAAGRLAFVDLAGSERVLETRAPCDAPANPGRHHQQQQRSHARPRRGTL